MGVNNSWGGTVLDPNAYASPCGAIGTFNDIQQKHFLMILLLYFQITNKSQLTKQVFLGQVIKDINTKDNQIVKRYNGSIHKINILLYG